MGWKNCISCGRLYREGKQGCTNVACVLNGKGDDAQGGASGTAAPKETGKRPTPPALAPKSPDPTLPVKKPEPVRQLHVAPPHPVAAPVPVASAHELPVVDSPENDPMARADGSIGIRQQLLDLRGASISPLVKQGVIEKLGKGINKQVYRVKNAPWVVAVITAGQGEAKWRAVKSEIEQLLALAKAEVTVPSLGPVEHAEDALIDVLTEDNQPAKAFIEQLIIGKHDLCRQEDQAYASKFADEIERVIGGRKNFNPVRWSNAKRDLDRLARYFKRGTDIPDFQIVVEEGTGHIYTIDPGDPEVTGSVLDKHVSWLETWQKVIRALEPRKK